MKKPEGTFKIFKLAGYITLFFIAACSQDGAEQSAADKALDDL
jgi:hypothetical protein